MPRRHTRRCLLAGAGLAGLGVASGANVTTKDERAPDSETRPARARPVPFHGEHQAGITTAPQTHLHLVAFDVDVTTAAQLRDLLATWTAGAERLTQGATPPGPAGDRSWRDSGEAAGHRHGRLTVTLGLGPGVFGERLGLGERRPADLTRLPAFDGDDLDPARSDGDLCLQICADDPQVAFHALHTLTRLAHGAARVRWIQNGFHRAPTPGATGRNVLGFKDGTRNVAVGDAAATARHVWIGDGWMRGGTYLVYRRVRAVLDVWDVTSTAEQERVIGRAKQTGAPPGGRHERDQLDPHELPVGAHVREAAPERNGGASLLRRGYNYSDGFDRATGQIDAGLAFISFQRSLEPFVRIQRRLATHDALNKHVLHTASAAFLVPPGARPGEILAQGLFAA